MWNSREETTSVPPAPPAPPVPPAAGEQHATARIGPSIVIKGDLISAEDLTIDGRIEGRIKVGQNKLTIGAGASITADLIAHTITIDGAVTGNVSASHKIEILEKGSVDGDLEAPRIAVREGGLIRGRVDTRQPKQGIQQQPFPVAV